MERPAKALRSSRDPRLRSSALRSPPSRRRCGPRTRCSRPCSLHPACRISFSARYGRLSRSFHSSRFRRTRCSHASISHGDWKHSARQASLPEPRNTSGRSRSSGRHCGADRICGVCPRSPRAQPPDIFWPSRPEGLLWRWRARCRNPLCSASRPISDFLQS